MVNGFKYFTLLFLIATAIIIGFAFTNSPGKPAGFNMPYKKAGLTERQAAAHLIDRFTFGYKPGEIDEVINTGLEKWFLQQLDGNQIDTALGNRLSVYDALHLSNAEVARTFPRGLLIARQAADSGIIKNDSLGAKEKMEYRQQLKDFMQRNGYRGQSELFEQFTAQKILSASFSNNQLHQLLTEFWFNHFNVSIAKTQCSIFIPAFERDVIRPNVAGHFEDLLLATAQSPAMLLYLDNFNSAGENDAFQGERVRLRNKLEAAAAKMNKDSAGFKAKAVQQILNNRKAPGLNENYAREVMELHTLGVDGGYTQQDVTQAARVLTGWTVFPLSNGPTNYITKTIEKIGEENLAAKGFVHKGDFFFANNRHDNQEKTVLGKTFAAGGGYEEGTTLISMLAHHPSTAKFICRKLAVKFVSDNPPVTLINKMAATFLAKDGDIKEVLKTMVAAPEFWQKEVLTQKTKSPFELAISAVRALNADIKMPSMLYQWISKMGQQMYYYQTPTGFPDKGQYWINTGSLLNRMNFGLAIAAQKIPGIKFNLTALNNNHEPESAADALAKYTKLLLPERNSSATIKRLTPLINDPLIQQKIGAAADSRPANEDRNVAMQQQATAETDMKDASISEEKLAKQLFKKGAGGKALPIVSAAGNHNMLAQVAGIILGSPEFQRR